MISKTITFPGKKHTSQKMGKIGQQWEENL